MTPKKNKEQTSSIKMFWYQFKYLIILLLGILIGVVGAPFVLMQMNRLHPYAIHTADISETNVKKLDRTYKLLKNIHLEELSEDDLINGAVRGMTEATGDPYTQYLDEEETNSFTETIESAFEGIGATLSQEGAHVIIMSPIKDAPAEKAGLLPNDEIIAVDGKDIKGLTLQKVVNRVRGKKGTEVTLTIKRGASNQDITIKRDSIPIHTVQGRLADEAPTVGIIEINGFSRPTADELEKEVKRLREQGAKQFVLDLRQNPGGLLDQALKVSNMFLKNGDVILKVTGRNRSDEVFKAGKEYGTFKITEPTVVLVDEGSASASEIVAGALSQSAHIPLLGTTTFGKGTVQTTESITDRTELKFTMSKWLTPDGIWIHGKGIQPNHLIERPTYSKLMMVLPSDDLVWQAENEKVLNVNRLLRALDYSVEPSISYSKQTKQAVEAFQRDHQLPVNGTIDDETASQMTRAIREKIKENDVQLKQAIKEVSK
ncbi:S41 family peptidase [Atopobacter phocae]|uniref:S41 family peptidase n=1 Tax=Atopobacter phocae TaxID=136492 RepID=UPI00046FDBE1|nr:S41 family peptidase [Atopobacter phocae]